MRKRSEVTDPAQAARDWLRSATTSDLVALGRDGLIEVLATSFGPGAAYPFAQAEVEGAFARVLAAASRIGASALEAAAHSAGDRA
jgi:hypothetical protein